MNYYAKNNNKIINDKGYIYIRTNELYDIYNVYKLGKTENIPDRDNQYKTSEVIKGKFILVFEIKKIQLNIIERLLQFHFETLNIIYDGGKEFYDKQILNEIETYFINNNFEYKKLSENEINSLIKKHRIKNNVNKIKSKLLYYMINEYKRINDNISIIDNTINDNISIIDNTITTNEVKFIQPREYQTEIIEKAISYYDNNSKGILLLTCGLGKTFIALWISLRLNSNSILIGVPNKELLSQWYDNIKIFSNQFDDYKILLVCSGIKKTDITNTIKNKKVIIITTYASCFKVKKITKENNFIFDFIILDEMHHLTKNNNVHKNQSYTKILEVKSIKQLGLTATLKIINNPNNTNNLNSANSKNLEEINFISNSDEKYFGKVIDQKPLLWAITNNCICDYYIQTVVLNNDDYLFNSIRNNNDILNDIFGNINNDEMLDNEKNLFISAYVALKSILYNTHHLVIYSNKKKNSESIIKYIDLLLNKKIFSINDLYYSSYNSNYKLYDRKNILKNFNNSKYGIISTVYCLGEGWDLPLLDGVLFAENMTSKIRIVQSALRPIRKNINEPNKISKIILPILNKDWLNFNIENFKKIKEVIYYMSLEDENIFEKIQVINMKINNDKLTNTTVNKTNNNENKTKEFDNINNNLIKELQLNILKRSEIQISYTAAKKMLAAKKLLSKEAYYLECEKDYRLPKDPEKAFKNKFNWIDYLSIDRKYYDFETCKNKIKYYMNNKKIIINKFIVSNNLKNLIKVDNNFPPYDFWNDYYDMKCIYNIINNYIINK